MAYCGIRVGVLEERSEVVNWVMAKIGKFPGLVGPNALMTPLCFFVPWPLALVAGVWRFSGAFAWALPHLRGGLNRIGHSFETENREDACGSRASAMKYLQQVGGY